MEKISGALLITALQSIVSLIAQLSLARILAPEILGQFAICSVLVTILIAVANLQCDKYIISGNGGTLEDRLRVSAYIEFILAIVFFVLALVLLPLILNAINKNELIQYSLILACSIFYTPFIRIKAALDSQLKFLRARLPQLIAQVVAAICAIFLALNGFGLWALIAWRLCAYLLEVMVLIITQGPPNFKVVTRERRKEVLGFVKPLYWSSVIFTFYASFDYYILAALISNRELGLYWLAFQLTNYLLIIKTTLNNILLPYYSKAAEKNLKMTLLGNHVKLLAMFYFVIAVLSAIFSDIAIITILGEDWADMKQILNLFTIIVMFKAFVSSFLPFLITVGKNESELQSTVFALLALAILLPILTIKMGPIGAVCAVLGSTLLSFLYLHIRFISAEANGSFLIAFAIMLISSSVVIFSSTLSSVSQLLILLPILAAALLFLLGYVKRMKIVIGEISRLGQ